MAAAELDGRPVAVSGSDDGTVRVWDLATGTPVGDPFTGHTGGVTAVAVAELDGRPVAISGSATGRCGCGTWHGNEPCGTTCAAYSCATRRLLSPQSSSNAEIA